MELKDFIGKRVVNTVTGKKYLLYEITSPVIEVSECELEDNGTLKVYRYPTINGDPFSQGKLTFEEPSLDLPFRLAYDEHCRSESGRYEEIGYWMRM